MKFSTCLCVLLLSITVTNALLAMTPAERETESQSDDLVLTKDTPALVAALKAELKDQPMASIHQQLLEYAFETATLIPIDPHIKSRSLAQEKVLTSALEAGQPVFVLDRVKQIKNWRFAAMLGSVGSKAAQQEVKRDIIEPVLMIASDVSKDPNVGDWRRGVIRTRIGEAYAWLQVEDLAEAFQSGAEAHEAGLVSVVRAGRCTEDTYVNVRRQLDNMATSERFEVVYNALQGYVALVDKFYPLQERRVELVAMSQAAWVKIRMPIFLRLNIMLSLVEVALEHKDQAQALEWMDQAQVIFDGAQWSPELAIQYRGRMSGLRYLCGKQEEARNYAEDTLKMFDIQYKAILNIHLCRTLLPLAKAYQIMGDASMAEKVFAKAYQESLVNPNSRPRAESLSELACAMVESGFEPSSDLWQAMQTAKAELKDPW